MDLTNCRYELFNDINIINIMFIIRRYANNINMEPLGAGGGRAWSLVGADSTVRKGGLPQRV